MPLHIALDGLEDIAKDNLIKKLQQFFTKKSYTVKSIKQVEDENITHILNNYDLTFSEKALLQALDKSLTSNWQNFDEYDIVLWNSSILSSYAYHTNSKVKSSFIKNINRFSPKIDLTIVIKHYEYQIEQDFTNGTNYDLIQKFDKLIENNSNVSSIYYNEKNPDLMLKEIVQIIFSELPTCSWCGRLFTKSVFNKKYCSSECKHYAKEEQNRINFRNFYNRYKDTMSESRKGALGSKGANLHGRANNDHEVEAMLIANEKKRLGL